MCVQFAVSTSLLLVFSRKNKILIFSQLNTWSIYFLKYADIFDMDTKFKTSPKFWSICILLIS